MARRGVVENPPNRFERRSVDPTAEEEAAQADAVSSLETRLIDDPTRRILATNQSPDIGFDVSVNPYRGCEHACSYCLRPDTPVLFADLVWRPIGQVRPGDLLVGFDEYPQPGSTRKLRKATVEHVWSSRKETRRVITKHGVVHTTADHRWLQWRNFRWSRTDRLKVGDRLRRIDVSPPLRETLDYRAGYIAGMTLGDGTFRYEPGWRSDKKGFPAAWWRVALADPEPLERLVEYLRWFGVTVRIRPFSGGTEPCRPMQKVETRALGQLARIRDLLVWERDSREYRRGFVAGFFDAEGSHAEVIRFSQVDVAVLDRVQGYGRSFGFALTLEPRSDHASTLRLTGGLRERIRFLTCFRPAIERKVNSVYGTTPVADPETIEAIERGPRRDVVDIQTSTGTFFAAGLATHNCYARPTHEYLGFSAGLDFETRILVKRDAPVLLRKALAARSWKPQVIAMSGVTDPYQPAERKLRITRGCLEVLADFRNPVAIITKNRLVARDADVLGDLASHDAAAVNVSITTLDPTLQQRMEPRASAPHLRLRAIEQLAAAGVPVGVMAAPVIPGLNDHEIPAILRAAADAGARWAGHIVLRLPHGVKEIFDAWLERHYPLRRDKVMHRIREVRGGRLNDPRFGSRLAGEGLYAEQVRALFESALRRCGLDAPRPELSGAHFRNAGAPAERRAGDRQLDLFG